MESKEVFVWEGDNVWFHYAVGEEKDMVIRKIWLPRQDQLQEMYFDFVPALEHFPIAIIARLYIFSSIRIKSPSVDLNYVEQFTSMEQLWLAFVMKEKYNKIWNGEEWAERL